MLIHSSKNEADGGSDIATASVGPRSTVATGPEEIQASKWELEEDTERFIQAAEVRIAMYKERWRARYAKQPIENCLSICMDNLQCSRAATELSIWGHGEPCFHVCDTDHHIWCKSIISCATLHMALPPVTWSWERDSFGNEASHLVRSLPWRLGS